MSHKMALATLVAVGCLIMTFLWKAKNPSTRCVESPGSIGHWLHRLPLCD